MELLIKHGADPNVYGECEYDSALSATAHNGSIKIAKLLLDAGADMNEGILSEISDSSKESNMENRDAKNDVAQDDGAIDAYVDPELNTLSERVKKLAHHEKSFKDNIKPPLDAADRRALEQLRRTALFEAASLGDAKMVNFMLDRGALIDLRNGERGETALIRACWGGHYKVMEVLLERGALIDKTDIWGRTPPAGGWPDWQSESRSHAPEQGSRLQLHPLVPRCQALDRRHQGSLERDRMTAMSSLPIYLLTYPLTFPSPNSPCSSHHACLPGLL